MLRLTWTRWRSSWPPCGRSCRGEDLLRHLSFGVQARARHAGRPARAQEVRGQRPAWSSAGRAARTGCSAPPTGPHGRGRPPAARACLEAGFVPDVDFLLGLPAKRPRIARSPSPSPRSSSTWARGSTAMPSCRCRERRSRAPYRSRSTTPSGRRSSALESRARCTEQWRAQQRIAQDLVALRRRPRLGSRSQILLPSQSPATPRRGRGRSRRRGRRRRRAACPSCSSRWISKPYVEKVVYAPTNPTAKRKRQPWAIAPRRGGGQEQRDGEANR